MGNYRSRPAPPSLPVRAKYYVAVVISVGACLLGVAAALWEWLHPGWFAIILVLACVASILKVPLPGITGTYSLSFLFLLLAATNLTFLETVLITVPAAVLQVVGRSKQRPTLLQASFNAANMVLSVSACVGLNHLLASCAPGLPRAALLALDASVFFFFNTAMVSGVLTLIEEKPFREVCGQWYFSSFPYFLIGAVLVGLLPLAGPLPEPSSWMLLLPPVCLAHFYYGLTRQREDERSTAGRPAAALTSGTKFYIEAVILTGATMFFGSLGMWESGDSIRFGAFLVVTAVISTWKVRLPRMEGTISPAFVVLLAAMAALSFSEIVAIGGVAGVIQSVWKAKRRPGALQVCFNACCYMISFGCAYAVCRLTGFLSADETMPVFFVVAAALQYVINTVLVATVLCLIESRPIGSLWQRCNFWAFPYYLVGAACAAVMGSTGHVAGWAPSLLVLPLLAMIYVSYRLRVYDPALPVAAPLRAESA